MARIRPLRASRTDGQTELVGANAGAADVPALSDVLFASTDHTLLPQGRELELAEEAVAEAPDLYEWSGGGECALALSHCKLINVEGEGSHLKLINMCGAVLGVGADNFGAGAANAVSSDGSRIFFTAPPPRETVCAEPSRLYMRVNGRETVEVSEPEPGLEPERRRVLYEGATPDGSKVFFDTETRLTKETVEEEEEETSSEIKLFEYDTEGPIGKRLKRIAGGVTNAEGPGPYVVISNDGSIVYYDTGGSPHNIYRYETATGKKSFVATAGAPELLNESSYTTPNGDYLVFAASGVGVFGEPRGAGRNELYRYDATRRERDVCIVRRGRSRPQKAKRSSRESSGRGC